MEVERRTVWIYLTDATSGRTEHSLSLKVKARSKPEIPGGDDNADPFREAIEEVNNAADRAEIAEKQAGEYAEQTKADAIKTGEDRTAIAEMVESVSGIGEQVQAVKEYKDQAQTAATNALLSEQKSEQAKESAIQAQANAETAEDMAEQHALEVAGDKAEVERLATQVRQDKSSVEQTVQGVGNTAQQAEQSINTAKTKAVEAVNASKSDAVKVVKTEGEKQTEAVQAKGQEVINSIPSDFTTQMATKLDKQQSVEHAGKALVVGKDGNVVPGEPTQQIEVDKTLTQEGQAADAKATGDKILQYAIKNTTSGECILRITDSAEEKLQDIKLFGKSEQLSTTGKNLFDFSNLESGRINTNTGALEEYNHTRRLADYIDITDITSFSVYLPGYNRANGTVYVVIHYYDKDKKYLSYRACGDGLEKYENITPVENAVYIKVTFEQVSIDNPQNIFKVQLEKGTKSTDYEPYTGGKPSPSVEYQQEIINAGENGQIEVKVTGKNLFDISKNPYKCDEEKICIPSKRLGEINITNGITFEEKTAYSLSWESYTITKPNSDWSPIFGVKYTDGTNEDFYMHLNKSGFKTNANKTIGYVHIRNPWSVGTEVNRIQIEKGTKRTEYEPFKLQTLTILLDRSLTKWDRIEKRDGVYGITYKHKVVEDFATLVKDSEPIYGNPGEKYFSVKADGATLNYDYSEVYSEVGVYKKDVQRLYVPKVMASSFIVGVNDTDTIETAKAHMHYKVIYETDAEEFVPLPQETQTALNNLHTYYPTTVMGNSEDCEMEVEYVADIKNYIDNKISENVASVISQYQTNVVNLLSLMPLSVQAGMVENDTNNILENVEEMKHE